MPTPEYILAPLRSSTDPDAMVMVQLAKIGSDLRKTHAPEFAFEAENSAIALAIANELAGLNFDVEVQPPEAEDENPNYWVIAKRAMILELAVLRALSAQFEVLAGKHRASYDGWGAEIIE